MSDFGADRALAASPSSRQGVSPLPGFDHGYEAWRPALVAFYRAECSFQRAENLAKGWADLDASDRRIIDGLKAAFKVAA